KHAELLAVGLHRASRQADKWDATAPCRRAPRPLFESGTTPFPESAGWKGRGLSAPVPVSGVTPALDATDPLPLVGGSTQRPVTHAPPRPICVRRGALSRRPTLLVRAAAPTR